MAEISDRTLFLEMTKTQALTINEIIESFKVARNTARAWVSHKDIEKVEGSWPPAYRRKSDISTEMPVVHEIPTKQKPNEFVLRWPRPQKEQIEELFDKVLDGEIPDFNFTEQFKKVDSQEALNKIRIGLVTGLLLVEHYEKIRKDEGMD